MCPHLIDTSAFGLLRVISSQHKDSLPLFCRPMNEATADNNGGYLLAGCHGNGCRLRLSVRERERERLFCAVCFPSLVLYFFLRTRYARTQPLFPDTHTHTPLSLHRAPQSAVCFSHGPIHSAAGFVQRNIYIHAGTLHTHREPVRKGVFNGGLPCLTAPLNNASFLWVQTQPGEHSSLPCVMPSSASTEITAFFSQTAKHPSTLIHSSNAPNLACRIQRQRRQSQKHKTRAQLHSPTPHHTVTSTPQRHTFHIAADSTFLFDHDHRTPAEPRLQKQLLRDREDRCLAAATIPPAQGGTKTKRERGKERE